MYRLLQFLPNRLLRGDSAEVICVQVRDRLGQRRHRQASAWIDLEVRADERVRRSLRQRRGGDGWAFGCAPRIMIKRLILIEGTVGLRFQKHLKAILEAPCELKGCVAGESPRSRFDLVDRALHFARTNDVPRAAGNDQRRDRQYE